MQRPFWKNPLTPWLLYLGIGFGSIGLGFVVGVIAGVITGKGSTAAAVSAPFVTIGVVTLALGLVPTIIWSVMLKHRPPQTAPPSQQPTPAQQPAHHLRQQAHKTTPLAPSTKRAPQPRPTVLPAAPSKHQPTRGHRAAQPLDLPEYPLYYTSRYARIETVGISHRREALVKALNGGPALNKEMTLDTTAQLVPEPTNPHDRNAIKVVLNGHHIGYVPVEISSAYAKTLTKIIDKGFTPTARADVWAVTRYGDGSKTRTYAHVRIALDEPHRLLPMNNPPRTPYALLPWGNGLQVTGEERHLDVLTNYVTAMQESLVIVTLHAISTTNKNGRTTEFAEVRLEGQRIGQMTASTSAHFLPTIKHLSDQGRACAAWGLLKGSPLAVQAVLQATKAHELEAGWLSQPHTIPALHDYPDTPAPDGGDPDLADDIDSIKRDMARDQARQAFDF